MQNYRTGHIRELAVNASGAIVVKVSIQGEGDKANILAQLVTDGVRWGWTWQYLWKKKAESREARGLVSR